MYGQELSVSLCLNFAPRKSATINFGVSVSWMKDEENGVGANKCGRLVRSALHSRALNYLRLDNLRLDFFIGFQISCNLQRLFHFCQADVISGSLFVEFLF